MPGAAISRWRRTAGCGRAPSARSRRSSMPAPQSSRPRLFEDAPQGAFSLTRLFDKAAEAEPAARPAPRRHLDACRHAGGDRAGGSRDSRRARPRPSSERLIRHSPSRKQLEPQFRAGIMASVPSMSAMPRPPPLHDPVVGAVPADADRGAARRTGWSPGFPGSRDPLELARGHALSADAARLPAGARRLPRRARTATPRSCRASCRSATSTRTRSCLPNRRRRAGSEALALPRAIEPFERKALLTQLILHWARRRIARGDEARR